MSPVSLSEEQQRAATSPAKRLTIVAPPGCGKTEVLAHRIEFLIQQLSPNQRVLALTFTNRSKANLTSRLMQTLGVARMRRYVSVRNFHEHATGVILAHGRTIGLDPRSVVLPKTSTLTRAIMDLESDWDTRNAAADILASTKRSPLSDAEVLEALSSSPTQIGLDLAIEVETARQKSDQLHYEDLLRHAQRIMRFDAVARLYQCHFGALVVDEFQDMSLQQMELAERSCEASRTYAGDPGQGIFGWTGAAPVEVLERLVDQCGTPKALKESYRSSPRVLSMVNQISQLIGQPSLVSAQPDRWPEGGCSARISFPDREAEADGIARLAREVTSGASGASVGIIVRSSWRAKEVAAALRSADLPVRRWDFAIDDPQTLSFIRETVTRLPKGATVDDARVASIALVSPADVDMSEQLEEAFEVLMQSPSNTIRSVLRELRITDPREPVGPGIHLLNAHKGKGQQFDWVVVLGLDEGHVPDFRAVSAAEVEEELRVLLVMLSRARYGVLATRSVNARGNKPPHRLWQPQPSRWWALLAAEYEELGDVFEHLSRTRGGPSAS